MTAMLVRLAFYVPIVAIVLAVAVSLDTPGSYWLIAAVVVANVIGYAEGRVAPRG